MKKRNWWVILLVVVLALVLAGCEKDDDDDDGKKDKDKDKVTEAVTPTESKPTDAPNEATPTPGESGDPTATPTPEGVATIWEFTAPTDIGTIDLPEITEEKAIVPDCGQEITLLRTEISQPRETVFLALKSDSWINGRDGQFVDYFDEEGTWFVATDNGPRWAVQYAEGLNYTGTKTGDSYDLIDGETARFCVLYTTETDQFSNENIVNLEFYNIDVNDAATQENIKRIVKLVYSERAANILLNITTEESMTSKDPNDMGLSLEYSNAGYYFMRSVDDDGAKGSIRFEVKVNRLEKNSIKANTYYESKLPDCPINPNVVFDGNIGNTDFYGSPETFADQYFALYPDKVTTIPAGSYPYTYRRIITQDGREYSDVEYHVGAVMSPYTFDLDYGFGGTGGRLDSASVKVTGTGHDFSGEKSEENYKQQLELMNKQMELVFGVNPEIPWDVFETENGETWSGKGAIEFTFLGEKLSGQYEITFGPRMGGQLHGEWIVKLDKYYER